MPAWLYYKQKVAHENRRVKGGEGGLGGLILSCMYFRGVCWGCFFAKVTQNEHIGRTCWTLRGGYGVGRGRDDEWNEQRLLVV